ncbi:para-nitrobenzyl esterase [Microbacterium sp. cf046]|uniref:carboxylesterase/lipase family protein n=1 Tax=Microbacterium sp. cf046 TaxID=1761803 RepID=UPI0008ED1905|nr:carboxylesterase family protein [Microbacterium sp. cf046]SFS14639.1 para-nitrobenzyl esterase [Microbacterium sp. cf046]
MLAQTTVTTEFGAVSGLDHSGLHHFRNIPFAAAPFGENRFLPPKPPERWEGTRDGTRPGPSAPQPEGGDELAELYSPKQTGEDCLTLEVWSPDPSPAARLPVVVHIHGGGYSFGGGSFPGYSGRNFARDGVVHVGINYRLGIDGFLYLGEGHDNLGLRDQTAALEWVQRNISQFGGDPSRVTIFGQSGGGVSVMFQLALPASRGLFHRAIAQSGCSMASVDADEAMRITRQVAKGLGVKPTVEGLRSVPLDRTTKATFKALTRFAAIGLTLGDRRSLLLSPFRGVHDTAVLPRNPVDSAGTYPGVPLMTGTTTNEMASLINGITTAAPAVAPFVRRGLKRALRMNREIVDAYENGRRSIRGLDALVEAGWTDWGFRIPTIRLVEARPETSWLYEFRWQREDLPPFTASHHAIDLPFARDDLAAIRELGGEPGERVFGKNPPESLAQEFHRAFVDFATTGEPGWAPYDRSSGRITKIFDTESSVVSDAAGAERQAWVGSR